MQEVKLTVNIVELDGKTFIFHDDKVEALFHHGKPVVLKAEGRVYIDGIAWGRSKSTKMRLKRYLGDDGDAIVDKVLSGEYELVKLVAPTVEVRAPQAESEQKEQ